MVAKPFFLSRPHHLLVNRRARKRSGTQPQAKLFANASTLTETPGILADGRNAREHMREERLQRAPVDFLPSPAQERGHRRRIG